MSNDFAAGLMYPAKVVKLFIPYPPATLYLQRGAIHYN